MKHRLVGAVIMVGVAVLVIPWLLSEQNGEGDDVSPGVVGNTGLVSKTAPLIPAGEGIGIANATDAATAAGTAPKKQPEPSASSTASQPALLADNPAQSATATVPATASTGWAVRVGTYSKPANVDGVVARLAKNGFTAHKERVKTALGDATRVWLGPYAKKKTAAKVSERLLALVGEKGLVIKHAP